MTAHQLAEPDIRAPLTDEQDKSFSSQYWLSYFKENRFVRVDIRFPQDVAAGFSEELRQPLIHSLQRFQIGETGEGKHLRKFASRMHDPIYEDCIDMFIKEEQYHARVLAEIIQHLDGTLLTWHWTDLGFIVLRRMLGLKTELFILLIAEIIGKCFYKACADQLNSRLMSDAFSLIVLDEIAHLEFHCSFLHDQMQTFPPFVRRFVYYAWSMFFFTACFIFIADHRRTLAALNVSSKEFLEDCSLNFHRTSSRALV